MTSIFHEDEIRAVVEPTDVVDVIEQGFVDYSRGLVDVPPVGLLHFEDPPGDVHIKYGRVRGGATYVVKVASGFYRNVDRGLPVSDGSMLLYDSSTGELLAILLDRGWLTEVRTGAAGAVSARHLAPPDVEHVGILGSGVQARFQLRALEPIVTTRSAVAWSRDRSRALAFADEMAGDGWSIEVVDDPSDVAGVCRLIVTATPATDPLLSLEHVAPGTHITAMGSDSVGKQELGSDLLGAAQAVVADSRSQAFHHGECAMAAAAGVLAESQVAELGEVIAGEAPGRRAADDITVADLTGVAVQDLVIAEMAFRRLTDG